MSEQESQSADGCVFCDIAGGHSPASVVYEDDRLISFLDIDPVTEGHLLIVPKAHHPFLADLAPDTFSAMASLGQRLAGALRHSGLRCEGINLFYADGEAAFQEVFHAHLHVFPRYDGDAFRITANWGTQPSRADLDDNAVRIRHALETQTSQL